MRRKKHLQDMSRDELIQFGQKLEEQRQLLFNQISGAFIPDHLPILS